MKRLLYALVTAMLLTTYTGCLSHQTRGGCSPDGASVGQCGGQCRGLLGGLLGGNACNGDNCRGWREQQPPVGPPGPPSAAYAYPYYTLHGPRDFLVNNPPSLGQ